jgi:hypothetical protein
MQDSIDATMVERRAEKRFNISWTKKRIPLKTSALFNNAKPSEEWHHDIDATAAGARPSESNFPWTVLRSHTDDYIKKKGKISQADIDLRLASLICAHKSRDIAIASASHAMTSKSLRKLLFADLNVAHGSYWGLKTWLQCLIAANNDNPASVSDLEALFARKLMPFVTDNARAAEWYLVGMSRALREMIIPSIHVLPEFMVLARRAIDDFANRLEGFRLKCEWASAREVVIWMVELANTSSPADPRGRILPEHILDAHFTGWRMWANWRPNIDRIALLSGQSQTMVVVVADLLALEGPDVLTGNYSTLKDGLIATYRAKSSLLHYRRLLIEVDCSTPEGLKKLLERVAGAIDAVFSDETSKTQLQSRFNLFTVLTVANPITNTGLELFEAACSVSSPPDTDVYDTIQQIYINRHHLGGIDIEALRRLIRVLNWPDTERLRRVILQDWLIAGIKNCIEESKEAVRAQMSKVVPWMGPWMRLALELHTFLIVSNASSPLPRLNKLICSGRTCDDLTSSFR